MWFLLGVILMIVGVAFCLLGPIKLPAGRVLRARHARLCGAILLCYFPLVFMLQPYIGDWAFEFKQMVNAGLTAFCLLAVFFVILRTTRPPKVARPVSAAALPPLLVDEPPAAGPVAAMPAADALPPAARRGKDKNLFDFS